MALQTDQFVTGFKALLTDMRTRTQISDEEYAQRFGELLEEYIKTGRVAYVNGLIAPNGAVTGTINGNIE